VGFAHVESEDRTQQFVEMLTKELHFVETNVQSLVAVSHFSDRIAQGTTVCRYNWHSAGSLGWPFPMLVKYKYIFQIKYTKAILSNDTRKLLRFEISKMLIAL